MAISKVDNDNQKIVAISNALELVNQTLERLEKTVTTMQQKINFLYEHHQNRELNKCQEILENILSKIDQGNSPVFIQELTELKQSLENLNKDKTQEILTEILKIREQLGFPSSLPARYKNPFTPWTPE